MPERSKLESIGVPIIAAIVGASLPILYIYYTTESDDRYLVVAEAVLERVDERNHGGCDLKEPKPITEGGKPEIYVGVGFTDEANDNADLIFFYEDVNERIEIQKLSNERFRIPNSNFVVWIPEPEKIGPCRVTAAFSDM